MTENKTKATTKDVHAFLAAVPDEQRRADAEALCTMMQELTGQPPYMYGSSIVGFGNYHYRYDSGREGDAPVVAFSPRAREQVIYLNCESDHSKTLLAKLGPHKMGKSCLNIRRLSDVDEAVLRQLVVDTISITRSRYPD